MFPDQICAAPLRRIPLRTSRAEVKFLLSKSWFTKVLTCIRAACCWFQPPIVPQRNELGYSCILYPHTRRSEWFSSCLQRLCKSGNFNNWAFPTRISQLTCSRRVVKRTGVTGPDNDQDQTTTTLFGRCVVLKFQDQITTTKDWTMASRYVVLDTFLRPDNDHPQWSSPSPRTRERPLN